MNRLDWRRQDLKLNARIALGDPVDNSRDETCSEKWAASYSHFPCRRVGKELNLLDRLAKFIEDGRSAFQQGPPVRGRRDAQGIAVQQAHANGLFQFRD